MEYEVNWGLQKETKRKQKKSARFLQKLCCHSDLSEPEKQKALAAIKNFIESLADDCYLSGLEDGVKLGAAKAYQEGYNKCLEHANQFNNGKMLQYVDYLGLKN